MEIVNIFGWDIDFVLDIRNGDRFRVLYEELYLDGEKVGEGEIIAAEFWNQGRHLTAYRYQTRDGDVSYFDSDGNSMRKEFIRTPVAFSRISSRFSTGRKHPILNKVRAHNGIDYAAPSGTPIKAAGKGKVIFAGVKGGYGNVLILKHGQRYSTLYAHMRGFAKGIRVGSRVNQSQTIGYVGASGLATGPHLHYEFRIDGVHRNPQTVPLPKASGIASSEKPQFRLQSSRLAAQMTMFAEAATLASSTSSNTPKPPGAPGTTRPALQAKAKAAIHPPQPTAPAPLKVCTQQAKPAKRNARKGNSSSSGCHGAPTSGSKALSV